MSRYILYFEPSKKLREQVKEYFRLTSKLYGPTEAHQYIPHCSMTGFFTTNQIDLVQKTLEQILTNLDDSDFIVKVQNVNQTESPHHLKKSSVSTHVESVRINIEVSEKVKMAIQLLVHTLQSNVFIREKPMDHVSLAYLSKPHLKDQFVDYSPLPYSKYAQRHFTEITQSSEWDIVLFEQEESQNLNEPHKFTEIQRFHSKKSSNQASRPLDSE